MKQHLSYDNSLLSLQESALQLLKMLLTTQSFSGEEDKAADIIGKFLEDRGIVYSRKKNNIWAKNVFYDPAKPTVLLNSHLDTVRPNPDYTRDPFFADEQDGKLFGLGSNDAGASLVSLLATFLYFFQRDEINYNLIFAATAEEETSGVNGIESVLPELGNISFALVGEPTLMQMAVAEKGLLVLDCKAIGKSHHAARDEGENAIYKAMADIDWFRNYKFPKVSDLLGPVKMTVTMIEAGAQHNVVPGICNFTVDIRINELYTHEEILQTIEENIKSEVNPRSFRIRSTSIALTHPVVKAGTSLGLTCYGSPTTSDKALIPYPSLKIGPGDSARSHTADEFVFTDEIRKGIKTYINLLEAVI
jgi:acetylornithine deacetylase